MQPCAGGAAGWAASHVFWVIGELDEPHTVDGQLRCVRSIPSWSGSRTSTDLATGARRTPDQGTPLARVAHRHRPTPESHDGTAAELIAARRLVLSGRRRLFLSWLPCFQVGPSELIEVSPSQMTAGCRAGSPRSAPRAVGVAGGHPTTG